LKLVELNGASNTKNSSQLSLVSNSTLINTNGTLTKQHQPQAIYSNGQINGECSVDKSHQRALFNEYYSNSNASVHLQNCQDQISKLQKHQQNLAQLPPMVPNHQYRFNNNIGTMNDSEQQTKQYQNGIKNQQTQMLDTQLINSRSLSEPRANQTNLANRSSINSQNYSQLTSNFAYDPNDDECRQSSNVDSYQHINGSAETYDNLSDHQLTHQSRIDTNKYLAAQTAQNQQFDRFNPTLRPQYNSMRLPNHQGGGATERDIKSVDREILYNYYKLNSSKQHQPTTLPPPPLHPHQTVNNFVRNTPKRQSLQCYNVRDIKSCERDAGVLTSSSSSSQNTPINNNKNSAIIKMMPPLPPPPPSIIIAPVVENDMTMRSRSGSVTPCHQQQQFETDATEDDDLTCTSSSIYQYDLNNNKSNTHKKDELKQQSDLSENDFLDNLDENDIENFETSKIKMKLMQKQLYDLTNLVNQALINKDLNQLAAVAQYNMQNLYTKNMGFNNLASENQHQSTNKIGNNSL
jgi:hypothetical protein